MARPVKKIVQEEKINTVSVDVLELVYALQEKLLNLEIEILDLKKSLEKPEGKSIHKIEIFTGEQPPTAESYNGMKMGMSDRIISMQNAIKILPPNMVVEGRQLKQNVEAIVGFKVSDEMMDEAYEGLK